jgi:V8-like Glu-specific endopeptidase
LAFLVCFLLVLLHGGTDAASGEGAPPAERAASFAGPRAFVPANLAGPGAQADGHSLPFSGLPTVGAVFAADDTGLQHHFCTGSVVDSPRGDLIVTAAHCLSDPQNGAPTASPILFVPGYHDGQHPFGVWRSTAMFLPPTWAANSDPDADVALVAVHKDGDPNARIQDVVGAEHLGLNQALPVTVGAIGYPGATDAPVSCLSTLKYYSATQAEFDCNGFTDGTSGGPLLRGIDPVTGLGTVVGVIGGYQEGGDTDDVSYAASFGDHVRALFAEATASATPSPATASGSASPSASPSAPPSTSPSASATQ